MKKKHFGICIIAWFLAFILTLTNCYTGEAFATKTNVKSKNNDISVQNVSAKKPKSNGQTDIIVKYTNINNKDSSIKSTKKLAKASKLEQKNYFKKSKIVVYEISPEDDLKTVIKAFKNDPDVEYAQPNYPLNIQSVPSDDKFNYQWALYNDGQQVEGNAGRANVDTNVVNAWLRTMGSSDVVIGVLDTGINISHNDLKNNISTNPDEIKGNGIDDDGNGYVDDISGWDFSNDDSSVYDSSVTDTHGTYIAGIIAAASNNGGIVGIAPNVKLLPLKFIDGTTGYTSDAIEAIEYARNMGVKIINCSFGGTDNNLALKETMQDSGILFICAAGNSGSDTANKNIYPAGFDIANVISVTSIDSKGILTAFANYGANVDVAAPGTSILSTIPRDGYEYYSGTSVSAAIVSGIAALVQSDSPNISILDIKNRILNRVVKCTALTGKVVSGGRVDAFAALSGTIQPQDIYVGPGNSSDILPTEGNGETDTWYVMDERASNVERFHYGEGGVNPASGNYSVTCIDMSVPSPGFTVNISRSYNSRNQKQTILGRGWTFGFEGKITNKDEIVEVSLPDGSCHVFHLKNGTYFGEGTRATFVRNVNGVDILTTTDQYKYGFSSSSLQIIYMEDKKGNRINLTYTNSKLTSITDTVGRSYTLTYNTAGLLSCVADPSGRIVQYEYNSSNLLTKVTDPNGGYLTYTYDGSHYLTVQTDQNNHIFQQLSYSHDYGDDQNKVISSTDAAGATWNYSYDLNKRFTTITDNNNRKWTYWFDAAMYTIRVQDPEGRNTITEYAFQDANTYYGDVLAKIDRNGNRTDYTVNLQTGNVAKITNPDKGEINYTYDQWNNVTMETDGGGNKTYYIYDTGGKNLLKKIRPLDGISNYIEGDTTKFAVTTYTYYTKSEAGASFGCNVEGLLKSVSDPEGCVTIYTHDNYGNIKTIKDASGNVITYTYDMLGRKLSEKTAKGNLTQWSYDKNGMVTKIINPDGGVERTIYDAAGYLQLEVEPNLYDAGKENSTTGIYTGTAGTRYEWNNNGYQKAVIDALGYRTEYTWDIYGNKATEMKPNGAIYRYVYDNINRLIKTYFKADANSAEVLMSEINYSTLSNGNSQITTTVYADDTQKSKMVTVKDYKDREVEVQYGDYSRTSIKYNTNGTINQKIAANGAITYYTYDALHNLTNSWSPVAVVDGNTMYSWTGYTYNKAGKLIMQRIGKPLVCLNMTTEDVYSKSSIYQYGQLTQEIDSEGRKTDYLYDGEGLVSKITQYITANQTQVTSKTFNYNGQPLSVTIGVRTGDLTGNNFTDNTVTEIANTYSYDKNGNLITSTDQAGNITSYTYDALNRALTTKKQLKDSVGTFISNVTTSITYTWDGQLATETDARKNTTRYTYDARGNQVTVTDALGSITLKAYDRIGRNTVVVSPKNYIAGKEINQLEHTEFTYDPLGRVIRQTEVYQKMTLDANFSWTKTWVRANAKTYQYDGLGNITAVTDAVGNTKETTYNLAGLLESETDAETKANGLSYTVKYTYNGLGQKVKEKFQGSEYTYTFDSIGNLLNTKVNGVTRLSTTYDYLGRPTSSTDGRSNTTIMSWNAFGKIAKIVTPGDESITQSQTIYQYDRLGNLTYTKDSLGKVTTYTYDSLGRNLGQSISDLAGNNRITSSSTYDVNGNVLTQKDGNGNVTSSTYDALNRLVTSTNAKGQITTYTYDANGKLTSQKDYLGNTSTNVYDGINRLVETRDALGKVVQKLLYNDADVQISSYDALNNLTQYSYDRNLRQTETIDAEGNTTSSVYDTRGNIIYKTDGSGNTTSYTYDGENRLICVEDAIGNKTLFSYDGSGNLTSQTDGNGNTTKYKYNAVNLLSAKTSPAGTASPTEYYTYLANGLLSTKTDRNGVVTTYSYDIFGRKTTEDAGGEVQNYTYDNNGNWLTMMDSTGTTTREYDSLNRNISKIVPGIGKSVYEYDLATGTAGEHAERTTDPKGNVTFKTFDKTGKLIMITVGTKNTQYIYEANGRRSRVIYPDGTKETYTYDRKNQVTGLSNTKQGGNVISSYSYTYDGAGNRVTESDATGTTTYTYDNLNRISTVTEPGGKVTTYTYDGAGNRKTEKIQSGELSNNIVYNYDSQNHLISSLSTGGATVRYIYDNNGNLLTRSAGTLNAKDAQGPAKLSEFGLVTIRGTDNGTGSDKVTTYKYDKYNRLVTVKTGSTTASYRYNAQGYRVTKTVNGTTTNYLYEGDKVVLETDSGNAQKAYQVYGNSLIYRSVASGSPIGSQSYYYLYNAHGDVTGLIDAAGNIAATYDYDAFGNIQSETGNADNYIKYAGYQKDDESGLYYLKARYYDSVTARFITEDTYTGEKNDPLSLNLYTYCHNNPVIYYDPTGHDLWKLDTLVKDSKGKIKIDNKKDTVTVTVNGKKKVYNQDDLYYYNGSYIIDDRQFKQDLNYKKKIKSENDIEEVNSKKVTSDDIVKSPVYKKLDEASQAFLRDATDIYGALGYNYYSTNISKIYNTIEKNKNHQLTKSQEYSFGLTGDAAAFLELNYNQNKQGYSMSSMEQQYRNEQLAEGRALLSMMTFNIAYSSTRMTYNIQDPDFRLQNGKYIETTSPKGYISNGSGMNLSWSNGGTSQGASNTLSGKWVNVNESMSDASRAYQTQITGKEGQAFLQNGVKFDGVNNGTLIEAKGSYNNFVNKKTGEFYDWFNGQNSLVDQANRQIAASEGAQINWYFSDQASMNATKSLFQTQGIKGINYIYEPIK